MRDRVKVARYVAFDHPLVTGSTWSGEAVTQIGDGIIGASVRPESIGTIAKVGFPYGFKEHPQGFLYNPVVDGGDA